MKFFRLTNVCPVLLGFSLTIGIAAGAPAYGEFRAVQFENSGRDIEGICLDAQDHVWLVDRSAATLSKYSSAGKLLALLVKPGQEGALRQPNVLALQPDGATVAVADAMMALRFYRADTGAPIRNLVTMKYCAPFGFFLTQKRIVYVGRGFKDLPALPPFTALTIFSTDLSGNDLRVEREQTVTPETFPAFFLLAKGFAAPLPGGRWAVCRGLPRELYILDETGRILKESAAPGTLPRWSPELNQDPEKQIAALYSIAHPVGLITARGLIGVLWQEQPGAAEQICIDWVDQELRPAGTTPLHLGHKLGPKDFISGAATDSKGALYLLIVSRAKVLPGESFLLKAVPQ
jgi:hypothetical protein